MFELSKQFRFDAAHALECEVKSETNRRIHGHSWRAEVTIAGTPDPKTGMLIDLGRFEQILNETRAALDHRFLNDISDLGPPTLENLSRWIWKRLAPQMKNLARVTVYRDSEAEICVYYGPHGRRP
jgi:6-pyruvoyltetrahydropterin/6-carboxytetrahydropterin synthase